MSPASSGMISMGTVSGIREKQPVAMGSIIAPFCVRAKIGDGGFDLDDKNRGVHGERDDVGSPSR